MTSVTPFIWFDDDAEQAIQLYLGLFPDASVIEENRTPDGALFYASFRIAGQTVMALNGGPHFTKNESFSFFVSVETQQEVDYYWDALTADGGQESQCGWLKDRFGLSWQIIPEALMRYQADSDRALAGRVQAAMFKMQKIIVADLDAAAAASN
ncbi:VOC family protein [Schumannella sp. 10F1B-5-1]|uniref:VOC family protein n=1 Tax=Schumannella sp. 10F1B-5-1 TaxID=2590780 RepID=UPI0011321CDE|nr:VOC family protein [Schumannella sp. 10F1B-5-1]TPW72888.1 VOC family protein [Schumannella sp. 10F1B-5-1]